MQKPMQMPLFTCIETKYCLSVEALVRAMDGDVESITAAIHTGLYRHRHGSANWQHFADPGDARRKWIAVDTLPKAVRQSVEKEYGDVAEAYYAELLEVEAKQRQSPEDLAWFLGRKVKKGEAPFSLEEAQQLCECCGWLRTLAEHAGLSRFKGKLAYYEQAAKVLAARNLYGLKVRNGRYLQRKVEAWKAQGRDALVNGRFGNENGQKLTGEGMKRLMNLYGSPLKPTYEDVAKIFNREATERGWPTLTTERVRQILSQCKQVWHLSRHGKEEFRKQFERSLKRRKSSFADALWSLDGFTIQLVYTNEQGQPCSGLYGYAVLDTFSDCIIGYSLTVGSGEPATLVQAAIRDAVRKTGMRPWQMQYDNGSANKGQEVQELMTRLARLQFPTAPYNGKSKPIENLIARLEGSNMRHLPNFKGGNITSPSIEKKANPDLLTVLARNGQLPDRSGAVAQVRLLVEVHNNTPGVDGKTPAERYRTPHDERTEMDYLSMVEAFWVERKQEVRYGKDGLVMEVDKKKFTYEVEGERGLEDADFRLRYLGDRFTVKYDPDDLEHVNLYQGGSWIATARQKYEFAMAKVDEVDGEGEMLRKNLGQRKGYIDRQRAAMQVVNDEVETLGFGLLDHRLLHKEAYNRMQDETLNEILGDIGRPMFLENRQAKSKARLVSVEGADGGIVQ